MAAFDPTNITQPKDYIDWQMLQGDFWSTGTYFNIAAGNTKKLVLKNSSDSGKVLLIIPSVSAAGNTKLGKSFNVTTDTQGSEPSAGITNKHSGKLENSTVASVEVGGDNETGVYSGGTQFNDKQLGSGQSAATSSPGGIGDGVANILDEGDNIALETENLESNAVRVSVDIDFIELEKHEAVNT